MTKSTKIAAFALIATFAAAPAFADNVGKVETKVNVENINQSSSATLGKSENKIEAGSVSGKNVGSVKTNVNMKNVNQSSSATLGASKNEVKLGNVE